MDSLCSQVAGPELMLVFDRMLANAVPTSFCEDFRDEPKIWTSHVCGSHIEVGKCLMLHFSVRAPLLLTECEAFAIEVCLYAFEPRRVGTRIKPSGHLCDDPMTGFYRMMIV